MKDKILKAITFIMVVVFILSGIALDSESIIPLILCLVSISWIGLFIYANEEVL